MQAKVKCCLEPTLGVSDGLVSPSTRLAFVSRPRFGEHPHRRSQYPPFFTNQARASALPVELLLHFIIQVTYCMQILICVCENKALYTF